MSPLPSSDGSRLGLPVTRPLTVDYSLSVLVALLMVALSVAGLLAPGAVYVTESARTAFLTNDVVNLVVGMPILAGSLWAARRGSLVGLLLWPGALLYALYNYTAYGLGVPVGLPSLAYGLVVVVAAYAIASLLRGVEAETVAGRLSGLVPVKTAGWVLAILGALYILRAISTFAVAAADGDALPASDVGVLVADVVLSAAMVASGALLLRRRPLGYVSGLGALFGASMLFVSLIAFLLLRPLLTEVPFALLDVVIVFLMGMVCFVPFALYVRGVLYTDAACR